MKNFKTIALILFGLLLGGCHIDLSEPQAKVEAKPPNIVTATPAPAVQPLSTSSPTPAFSTLSWQEQQDVWKERLADIRTAVKADNQPDSRKILAFLETNGKLVDSSKKEPERLTGKRFHIVVINGNPATCSEWENAIGDGPNVFAVYKDGISAVVVKKADSVPRPIQGTVGYHETVHAYNWRTKYLDRGLSLKETMIEEVNAFTPQVRMFRALYAPDYEPFRQQLMLLVLANTRQRMQLAKNQEESFDALFPSLAYALSTFDQAAARRAFHLPDTATLLDLAHYLNFAFIDVGFEVLEKNTTSPWEAQKLKPILIQKMREEAGFND
ncbi:MAG TPA: hypothetical protein VLA04_00725 [Verrucomicrobiae bacterium]|nr:hypothetical protein [Verrucomicrobiae bacterium]